MSNPSIDYLNNRLSLRTPQLEALKVLDDISDFVLDDNINNDEILRKVKMKYPSVRDFDRNFPSLCFALATGVGKTRLMGAFIAYLYIVKGIKNFMVIAPNITIYNKLRSDFSNESSDKYVFKGLKEFVQENVNIVDGENYKEQGKSQIWNAEITINIFNIDKINKDVQSIKDLSEYLGQSYYDFLIEQKDLVILMDESHHYRADRGMQVINELKPKLGLELTATPQIERHGKTIKFNNIIYDYPLSRAMIDGYVKEPSVATKKNFNPDNFSDEEIDVIKLNDGLAIHENTKVALEEYALENEVKLVKPFTMVVCKNIDHANKIINYIKSDKFYNGKYKDKVMMITSKDGKAEKDENIQKLLFLENPLNTIEIVVHVNMLKEGWDVNNLYTIIPLRTSASQTLTEQTMGRGLRLPYGKRTGNETIDRLTIVSHDKYQAIIDEANKETSILKASNITFIDDMDLSQKETIVAQQTWMQELDLQIEKENNTEEKQKLELVKATNKIVSNLNIDKIDLKNENIKNEIIEEFSRNDINGKNNAEKIYDKFVDQYHDEIISTALKNRINIPYVSINKSTINEQIYKGFKLDVSKLEFKPLDNDIMIRHLGDGESIEIKVADGNMIEFDNAKEILIDKLFTLPSLDYEKCSDILNSKVDEYIDYLERSYSESEVINILYNYSNYIAKEIGKQIMSNVEITNNIIEENIVVENPKIYNPVFTKKMNEEILNYKEAVEKTKIKSYIFNGFKKACHNMYKFDSNTEKDFAFILEHSNCVLKWLRPDSKQFNIYWNRVNKYEPDFIVETNDKIFMVEIKAENQVDNYEVQEKKKAGIEYCSVINNYRKNHSNIKEWKYLLIEDSNVKTNYDFDRYI